MISIARKRTLTGILAASFGALGVALATGAGTVAPSYEEGVKVGDKAPDFTLTDIHGEEHKLSEYTEEGKIVVLEWFNPDCPFVVNAHEFAVFGLSHIDLKADAQLQAGAKTGKSVFRRMPQKAAVSDDRDAWRIRTIPLPCKGLSCKKCQKS